LFNQTAAECTNLFSVLNAIEPPEAQAYLFSNILPFELEVMQTRLLYWGQDHMGYLDALSALLSKCKSKAREAGRNNDSTNASMWTERGSRVILIIASQMVEMKVWFGCSNAVGH
jgi:trafficking protein particle complex subunit 12